MQFDRRMDVKIYREPYVTGKLAVLVAAISTEDGKRSVAIGQPLTLRTLKEDELGEITEPTFRLSGDEAQQFMDELWRAGIRPTEGAGSVGQLAAVERHLEDMRKLVFETGEKT